VKNFWISCFFLWGLTDSSAAATISVQPPTVTVSPGQSFFLNIDVVGVADLYGFQFDLGLVPGILSANSITEGAFLPSGGSTFFIPGAIENTTGTISFNADTLVGAIPGVTGNGTLVTVQFKALAAGVSPVSLLNITLLDSGLVTIPVTAAMGTVTVQGSAVIIPEPNSLSFFACLVLVLMLVLRSRQTRRPLMDDSGRAKKDSAAE